MENLTSFVSSRGLLKSCGCHNKKPISGIPQLDAGLVDAHRPLGSIYVCTDALKLFSETLLPRIRDAFTLVSGDSDVPVDDTLISSPAISTLLESEYLVAWYAQNLTASHAKLNHLPIGLDYHTMWDRPGFWGMSPMSCVAQENSLINTLAASPDIYQRYLSVYCNWHFALDRGDRRACFEKLDRSVCFFETRSVPRNSTWLRQAECAFVASPEGAGIDCHRTWEALLLGCIPIVKKSALTGLFAELPVLIVDDWQQVNRDLLLQFLGALSQRTFDYSSLFREHWVRRFSGRDENILDAMSYSAFRQFITRKTG